MLDDLIKRAEKDELKLAPFIGIGCPGVIARTARSSAAARTCRATGKAAASICRSACATAIPEIDDHETVVVMHNDAVVQGLSEVPIMQDVDALGRAHHRHGPRQRPLHQQEGRRLAPTSRAPHPPAPSLRSGPGPSLSHDAGEGLFTLHL